MLPTVERVQLSLSLFPIRCDSGARHLSKFHNDGVLARDYGIELPEDSMDIDISDLLQG
jgi:hypothetical protein